MNTEQIMHLLAARDSCSYDASLALEASKALQAAVEALVQERDALKADALRWRYMRSKGADWFSVQKKAHDIGFDGGLDEAVNAALKGKS
jgi:hypothetical protein